jgi:hypothetical protein
MHSEFGFRWRSERVPRLRRWVDALMLNVLAWTRETDSESIHLDVSDVCLPIPDIGCQERDVRFVCSRNWPQAAAMSQPFLTMTKCPSTYRRSLPGQAGST